MLKQKTHNEVGLLRTHLFLTTTAISIAVTTLSGPARAVDTGPSGQGYNNQLGRVLAVGDFNDDGDDDLAMGLPFGDVGSLSNAGKVLVLHGDHLGQSDSPGFAWPNSGTEWSQDSSGIGGAAEAWDYFGLTLAVGDFDGDGYDDLVVGAPPETIGSASNAGGINVIYGGAAGLSSSGNQTWNQNSSGIGGASEENDRFGDSLAAGDFNDDGYDDLAIGVPNEAIGSITNAGMVNIIYGSQNGLSSTNSQTWHQDSSGILDTSEVGDRFGSSLAAGDLNGDGYDDLAVGVPFEAINGHSQAGAVHVILGGGSGLSSSGNQFWHQDSSGVLDASEDDDFFGDSLAIGDFNDDGYGDLAVGVTYEDVGFQDAGAVHVFYGGSGGLTASGDQSWHQDQTNIEESTGAYDYFGKALAVGDFDRDGIDDLAIGVPGEDIGSANGAGAVNVIFGTTSGLSATGDVLIREGNGSVESGYGGVWGIAGNGEQFGYALAVGDFADEASPYGLKDQLVVGAPTEFENLNNSGNLNGMVFLFWDGPTAMNAGLYTYLELRP